MTLTWFRNVNETKHKCHEKQNIFCNYNGLSFMHDGYCDISLRYWNTYDRNKNIMKWNTNQFTPYVMISNWKPHKNIKLQEMQFCMFCIKRNYFACIALIFMFVHCLTWHEARITISWQIIGLGLWAQYYIAKNQT